MRVLLVEPKIPRAWSSNLQFMGLLKIGAYHRAIGDEVEYVKGCVRPNQVPDLVLVTSMYTYHYRTVWDAVRYFKQYLSIRNPKGEVHLGGIYATLCPEHAKKSGADKVFVGKHPQAKDYAPDITLLNPIPKFAYCMTSRGCSGNCTFCATHLLYGHGNPRQRPIEEVFAEIKLQISRGVKAIYFGDDDFGFNSNNHIEPLLDEIISQKLKVDFYLFGGMQSRHVTSKLAKLMKKARFKIISLGFESSNDTVLKRMGRAKLGGKSILKRAVKHFVDAGFREKNIIVFFMTGLPYQKLEDMIETLIYLLKLGVWTTPQRWAPIPGTPDFKLLNLDKWDLEDLYHKKFVVPNQNDFTHEDLKDINRIARFFNMGRKFSDFDILSKKDILKKLIT